MLGSYNYTLMPLELAKLDDFMMRRSFLGINITIPYKQDVISYCSELDITAREIGSVNTIINSNGKLKGYNTDHYGFCSMVKRAGISFLDKSVLILGNGGTALTANYSAKSMGACEVSMVSRSGELNYDNISKCSHAQIIINTTPVGMYPNTDDCLINISDFPNCEAVVDVIYNPLRTRLLLSAEDKGITYANGLPMLVYQAKKAAELFIGEEIPDSKAEYILSVLTNKLRNIVLIGMPSCGKSAIGEILAKRLNMEFADTDAEIEKLCKMSVPEIFSTHGEKYFRKQERKVIEKLSLSKGRVIATGGGAIESNVNCNNLRMNSLVCYIKRDLSELSSSNRPLSATPEAIRKLYERRSPLYEQCADINIDNKNTIDDAIDEIIKSL